MSTIIVEQLSIVEYAQSMGFYSDENRKSILEINYDLIKKLQNGELKQTNRFRVLLLGLKSVGKSSILKLISDYVGLLHKDITVVNINYLGNYSPKTLIYSIANEIKKLPIASNQNFNNVLNEIIAEEEAYDRIKKLEIFLIKFNIFIL
jgi:Cdc6-like AAA superfamily ATPase